MNRDEQYIADEFEAKKCRYIKKLIEDKSGVKDIGIRNRERHIVDLRKIYASLCREFTLAPLRIIAEILNIDHSTVLHNLRSFDNLYNTQQLSYMALYDNIHNKLSDGNTKFKISPKAEREELIRIIVNQKKRIKELEKMIHDNFAELTLKN